MGGTTPPPAHSATKNKRRDERPEGEEWIYLNWGIFLWWTENRYLLVKLNGTIKYRKRIKRDDPKKDKEEIKRHLAEVEDLIQEGYTKWGLRQIEREKKKAMKRESKEVEEKIKERKMESKRLLKMQKEAEREWRMELRMEFREEKKKQRERKRELKKDLKMERKREKITREWRRERHRARRKMAEASEKEASTT
ncbi:hypothetical protein GTR04_0828 [Trichophyton interdigitale]|uniref:Uncharacterized protein n=1 Tax=Trichophyton interdigitale TaxID=101480 RepID=A0A9P4YKX8_9EURO|nr:hypothetical protein GY631_1304 [Trichophyton interdigitale]KAF3899102.1 hypothetical protein GY632_1453 [Trichophyton interdigitale]KAG8211736.1 hypothetical protein GTR04_0828 [Trichophyton interdigitale]